MRHRDCKTIRGEDFGSAPDPALRSRHQKVERSGTTRNAPGRRTTGTIKVKTSQLSSLVFLHVPTRVRYISLYPLAI